VFTRKNETQRAQNTFALAADERLELSWLIACIIVCHFLPRGASHDRDLHPLCISFEPFLFTKIWTKDDERRERMKLICECELNLGLDEPVTHSSKRSINLMHHSSAAPCEHALI
jgi:hypothetical protein